MPEIPEVSAIAQQVRRASSTSRSIKQRHVLTDELDRLRAALVGLEGQARSRVNTGRRNRKPGSPDAKRSARPRCQARACAGTRATRQNKARCSTRSRLDR